MTIYINSILLQYWLMLGTSYKKFSCWLLVNHLFIFSSSVMFLRNENRSLSQIRNAWAYLTYAYIIISSSIILTPRMNCKYVWAEVDTHKWLLSSKWRYHGESFGFRIFLIFLTQFFAIWSGCSLLFQGYRWPPTMVGL